MIRKASFTALACRPGGRGFGRGRAYVLAQDSGVDQYLEESRGRAEGGRWSGGSGGRRSRRGRDPVEGASRHQALPSGADRRFRAAARWSRRARAQTGSRGPRMVRVRRERARNASSSKQEKEKKGARATRTIVATRGSNRSGGRKLHRQRLRIERHQGRVANHSWRSSLAAIVFAVLRHRRRDRPARVSVTERARRAHLWSLGGDSGCDRCGGRAPRSGVRRRPSVGSPRA